MTATDGTHTPLVKNIKGQRRNPCTSRVMTPTSPLSRIASQHLSTQCRFASSSSNPHHPKILSCNSIGGGEPLVGGCLSGLEVGVEPSPLLCIAMLGEALSLTPFSTSNDLTNTKQQIVSTHHVAFLTKQTKRTGNANMRSKSICTWRSWPPC